MRASSYLVATAISVGLMTNPLAGAAWAASPESIALKAGETADLGTLYWVSNCHSELKGTPTAEVMEGPPELSATVKAEQVVPRKYNCAKTVAGGRFLVTASKDIKARQEGKMFVRIKYVTRDGDRQSSREIDYTLFPEAAAPPSATPAPAGTPSSAKAP